MDPLIVHNASDACAVVEPKIWEFWHAVPRFVICLEAVGLVVAFITGLLAILQFRYIFAYVSSHRRANLLAWLASVFPSLALCHAVGLFVPKADHVVTILVSLIFARSIFTFVELLFEIFGGRDNFYSTLDGSPMLLRSGILFRWCLCIKPTVFTRFRIDILCWMIYQHAIIRTLRNVLYTILAVGGIVNAFSLKEQPFVWIGVIISLISTISAMYSAAMLRRRVGLCCQPYRTNFLFACFEILLALFNFQRFVYDVVANFTGPSCYSSLTPSTLITFYYNFGFIIELFLLSVLATVLLRGYRCALFDKHPTRYAASEQKQKTKPTPAEAAIVSLNIPTENCQNVYMEGCDNSLQEVPLDHDECGLDEKQPPISAKDPVTNHRAVAPSEEAGPRPAWSS